jgi:hypothetical protein
LLVVIIQQVIQLLGSPECPHLCVEIPKLVLRRIWLSGLLGMSDCQRVRT